MNKPLSNILSFQNCSQYNVDSAFSFTGKERDEETGYSYFGARYYDADLLTGWMSVDPMADKYPSLSPFSYCGWNPMILKDPNGMIIDSNTIETKILILVRNNSEMENIVRTLAEDPDFTCRFEKGMPIQRENGSYALGKVYTNGELDNNGNPIIMIFYSDPSDIPSNGTIRSGNSNIINKATYSYVIAEEIYHAFQVCNGDIGFFKGNDKWITAGLGLDDEVSAKQFAHRIVYGNTRYKQITAETLQQAGYTNTSSLDENKEKTGAQSIFKDSFNKNDFVDPSRVSRHRNTNFYIVKG